MRDLEAPGDPEGAAPAPEAGQIDPAPLGPAPWEDPELHRWRGFYQTVRELLLHPASFFARPAQGGVAEPLGFALIAGTTGSLLALFWGVILLAATGPGLKSALAMAQMSGWGAGTLIVLAALTPLAVLTKLALGSLCLWAAAALLGVKTGLAPVWRICCYATAGMAVAVVPFLGAPLASLTTLFILHQGLAATWGMSAWRALGALALFLALQVLAWACLLGGFLALLALLGLLFLG